MSKNSKDSVRRLHDFFAKRPDAEEKAWNLIYEFYHQVLTHMEKYGISRADLAKKMGKSRAAVSLMFNKSPNISILKMSEIAEATGIDLVITNRKYIQKMENQVKIVYIYTPVVIPVNQYSSRKTDWSTPRSQLVLHEPRPVVFTSSSERL